MEFDSPPSPTIGAQPIPSLLDDIAEEERDNHDIRDFMAPTTVDQAVVQTPVTTVEVHTQEGETHTVDTVNNSGKATHERKFRLHGKRVFATWPQCDKPIADILNLIKGLPDYDWAVVCAEQHEDGSPHRHAIFAVKKKLDIKSATHFDFLAGSHGHYEGVKSIKDCMTYVTKSNNYVADGINVADAMEGKAPSTSTAVAKKIMQGATNKDIMEEYPGFYLLHSRNVKEFQHEWRENQMELTLKPWTPLVEPVNATDDIKSLISWINSNVGKSSLQERPIGTLQLFLWGKTRIGKSSLVAKLATMTKTYFCPMNEHFFNGLDDSYKLIIYDEFHGQQPITFMNQFVDGQQMVVPTKGGQYHKKTNPPFIVISNYPLQRCYPKVAEENPDHMDALLRRFLSIELTHDLFNLL